MVDSNLEPPRVNTLSHRVLGPPPTHMHLWDPATVQAFQAVPLTVEPLKLHSAQLVMGPHPRTRPTARPLTVDRVMVVPWMVEPILLHFSLLASAASQ